MGGQARRGRRRKAVIYLDASALVTYVTERPYFPELDEYLKARSTFRPASSTVGLIETVRNCDRIGSFPNLMARLVRDYDELELTREIRDDAANMSGGLTTLDAIHVATAETLGTDLVAFITYDARMASVANVRGLPVASPGVQS